MKKLLSTILTAVALLIAIGGPVAALGAEGCTPGEKEGARTAIDVVQAACIVANMALPDSKVAEICGVTTPFLGPMQTLLSSSRVASAQAVAAAHTGCSTGPDGGAGK